MLKKHFYIPQKPKTAQNNFNIIEKATDNEVQCISIEKQKIFVSSGSQILVFDSNDCKQIEKISRSKIAVNSCDVRSDGELVLSADGDGSVMSFIVSSHSLLKKFTGFKSQAMVAKFTPDGYSVIAGSLNGELIMWDLAQGLVQFGVKLSKETINDICFIDQQVAIVSCNDQTLHVINFRMQIIESGVSYQKPKVAIADYKIASLKIDKNISKIFKNEQVFYCSALDYIYKVVFESNQLKIISKSQQILKGIKNVQKYNDFLVCGCQDGTIRKLSPDLSQQEIIYNFQQPITAFCADEKYMVTGFQSKFVVLTKEQQKQNLNELEKLRQNQTKPRQGIDTVIRSKTLTEPSTEAEKYLIAYNYAQAMEYALSTSFEQTVAVLREIECLGGRAPDLALAGLSDDGVLQLIKHIEHGVTTEWSGLLLKALLRCQQLGTGKNNVCVQQALKRIKTDVKERLETIQECINLFE